MLTLEAAPPIPDTMAEAFAAFPQPTRSQILRIRQMIFEVAETTPGVGALTETLKWGEPAYLTEASRSGSTIRLGVAKSQDNTVAILFNCRTTLVETFRGHFADVFAYEGNRAILIPASVPLPETALAICLAMALTHHRQAK
ncbi:hypothetical protein ABID16_000936 [Rhizobium aquaticum]|uniref:YdhG-like domain-containing protein n=1 Tax=Rhizobium aquaticum TaxID=1549636 RepID=A0ABV2IW49_9HYPH